MRVQSFKKLLMKLTITIYMKHIFTLLILMSLVAFSQEKKKVIIDEHEFDDIEEEVKFVSPSDGIIVPSKGKKVSEWGEEVFDKPPIIEKEWHEPTSFDPDKYIEEDTILAKLNKKPNPLFSDEYVYLPLDTIDKTNNKLKLDEATKIELNNIVRKMIANGESDEDIQLVINYFKNKYGKIHLRKSQPPISNSSTFLKEFKKFALPIITIIALVFLCYRLTRNITVAKIKTVLKSDAANKIYKIVGLTVFVSSIFLWYTNPTLREFKEITPSKLAIEKDNGFCEEEWKLSHTKVKNCIFYSYYKFSFGCSDYNRSSEKVELIEYKEYYYIGIFNNFYRVEYP
jgi:cytochrome c-type biogenesis protein CcmH/NrfF